MSDQPGTAGRSARRFVGCAVPLALGAILLALAVLMRPVAAPSQAQPLAQTSVAASTAQLPVPTPAASGAQTSATGIKFPALTGPVVDQANVIPDDEEARLTQKLLALKQQTNRQLQVVTLADLQGYDIADYGYQLGRNWGLGSADKNDAAILIIAPTERRMRIEVGYGLEATVTDGLSSLIISKVITPKFKAGDLPGGIEAGTDALITQLQLPPEQAKQVAAQANAKPAKKSGINAGTIMWIAFVFLFFILPMLRRRRGGKNYRSSGLGPIIMWSVLDGMTRGGGGGSSGWGGGGGGGGGSSWGGGGGSFGGGGSSGSW